MGRSWDTPPPVGSRPAPDPASPRPTGRFRALPTGRFSARAGALAAVRAGEAWAKIVAWTASLHLASGAEADDRRGAAAAQAQWLVAAALAVPLAALVVVGPLVAAVIALAFVIGLWQVARGADARRAQAGDAQLPILLEGIARQLRSGGSLLEAIVAQADDSQSLGPELACTWAVVASEAPVAGVVGALDRWVAANDRPPVRLAAAALALAAETGGSPARAVDGVASTLRARAALAGEVRALTAQARASAAVIALAPVAFALLAGATDARTRAAYRTPTGTILVLAGLVLDGLGAWWMARLCRVPVAA